MFTKVEYENLINNSNLFDIDKENSPALYQTEQRAFLALLTDYYQFYIYPNRKLETYGFTLMQTAVECIKYYDKSKGKFLHLFNMSMKRDLRIAKAKELIDNQRQGIKIAKDKDKLIRKIIALANSKNLDINDYAIQTKIAEIMSISVAEVSELIQINYNAIAVPSMIKNDDGDEIELFDMQKGYTKQLEDEIVDKEIIFTYLDKIEIAYNSVQERQKKMLSMLITSKFIGEFGETTILNGYTFCNVDIMESYKKSKQVLTDKQIAEKLNKLPESISRAYKEFFKKIKIY